MGVSIGGPYRIPGEIAPDLELEPQPVALSYALPDAGDELALLGEPRIGVEPEPFGQQWSERRWNAAIGVVFLVWAAALLIVLL